jgi:NAD(P)H-hydrate epimerase
MKLLNATQIKEWDQYTIQHEPISSIDLMERASLAFVHWYVSIFNDTNIPVDIFCGNGNNGGAMAMAARVMAKAMRVAGEQQQ